MLMCIFFPDFLFLTIICKELKAEGATCSGDDD